MSFESCCRKRRVVFVLSGGRTGTVALAHYFSQAYPAMLSVNEPADAWAMRMASNLFIDQKLSRRQMGKLFSRWRRDQLDSIPVGGYLETNASLWGFASVIARECPQAVIVHVVRDIRTYVSSVINYGSFSGIKGLANVLVPYWIPRRKCRGGPRLSWWRLAPHAQAAWLWTVMNKEIADSCEGHPSYLRFRFEDLFRQDGAGIAELADRIGCAPAGAVVEPFLSGALNTSKKTRFPRWTQLDRSLQNEVLVIGGAQMRRFGYL